MPAQACTPVPKREMPVRSSLQVEMLGIVEFIRVAVRRANTEMDISSPTPSSTPPTVVGVSTRRRRAG